MHKMTTTLLLLAATVTAQATPSLTVEDVTYESVILKKEYPLSFFIKHNGGTAFVQKSKLTEEQISSLLAASTEATPEQSGDTSDANSPGATENQETVAPKTTANQTNSIVGQDAPDVRLMDSELKPTKLSDLRGKVVLLNFNNWAGCEQSCLPDFPLLAELHEKYAEDPVEIVSVLSSFNHRTWEEALERQKITWKMNVPDKIFPEEETPEKLRPLEPLPDGGTVGKLSDSYGVKTFASTVIVGKDGKVVGLLGPVNASRQEIEDLIAASLAN